MSEEPKAFVMIISIVGAFHESPEHSEKIHRFTEAVMIAMDTHFPDFLPARWPVTISVAEIRDDYIQNHNKRGTHEPDKDQPS